MVKPHPLIYFNLDEFACPCCGSGAQLMNKDFVYKLDSARGTANIPFVVTSGWRCPVHNLRVGGSIDSAHLQGLAADIEVKDSMDRWKILRALVYEGFTRIGIGPDVIHVDDDDRKPQRVAWLYTMKNGT